MNIQIQESPEAAYDYVVRTVLGRLQAVISEQGQATLIAAGGSTFVPIYNRLAEASSYLSWDRVSLLVGDERMVPEEDPRSNAGMIKRELINLLPEHSRPHFYPIITETDPSAAAAAYRLILPEHIDIALLGLGPDGHTASLFAASRDAWMSEEVIVAEAGLAPFVTRISLTPLVFNRCRDVVVVALGSEKADVVAKIHADTTFEYPLSYVDGDRLEMVLDNKAAMSMG